VTNSRAKTGLISKKLSSGRTQRLRKAPGYYACHFKGQTAHREAQKKVGRKKPFLSLKPEFAKVLRHMERQGNILGATLRDAWDGKNLCIKTKNEPVEAWDNHLSVVSHVTQTELSNVLNQSDI